MKNKKFFTLILFLIISLFFNKDFNFNKKNLTFSRGNVFVEKIDVNISGSAILVNNGNGTNTLYTTKYYYEGIYLENEEYSWMPIDVDGDGIIGNEKIIDFGVGFSHLLILVENDDETRTIYSMGLNNKGQAGNGTTSRIYEPIPIDVDGDGIKGNERIVNVYADYSTSAAIVDKNNNFNDGGEEIWVWGSNSYWIFNYEENVLKPTKLPLDSYIVDKKIKLFNFGINNYSLIIYDDKNDKDILYNWGNNSEGQIGDGTTSHKNKPTQIDIDGDGTIGNEKILNVENGYNFSSALLDNGDGTQTFYTWGNNFSGQLGNGTQINSYLPSSIDVDGDGTIGNEKIVNVSIGSDHCSLIVLNSDLVNNTLYTWGQNDHGQLGDGTYSLKYSPTPIDIDGDGTIGNEKIIYSSFGSSISSVILKDGETNSNNTYIWGRNNYGQIGNGEIINKNRPFLIIIGEIFNFFVVEKNQTSVIFEFNTNLNLAPNYKDNLILYDQNEAIYETRYDPINDNYIIENLKPGKMHFFNTISFDYGLTKYNIKSFFNVLTDYRIIGIQSWNSTSTTAEIAFDITSTNFGSFSEQERTIELEYNSSPVSEINNSKSLKETQEFILDREKGLINLSNLNKGTKYEITKISYNKNNDGSFKYFLDIDYNNEIITLFNGIYFVDINNSLNVNQESITSNSFKFFINVSDEGDKFGEYNFIYLFFKNYKNGESPILAYKTNPSKSGSGIYEFEVRNLSSNTTYEFIGISVDRFMSIDDDSKSEKFENKKILTTKINSKKSYIYLILILFLLLLLSLILMILVFKSINSFKSVFHQINELQ